MSTSFSTTMEFVTSMAPTMSPDWQSTVLWMLVAGFVIAFILAFAVGANDVANSFGTTVGAGTLSLKQACILASIFETLGAILLGAKVGTTIRKGIIDVNIYHGEESLLMAGEISAMLASGSWQLIATFLKLPVSGTHSIVGATVGFSLVAHGAEGVDWAKMGLIVGSWFLSPVLAGIMAALFYFLLRKLIFQKIDPVRPGLIALPIMYGFTIAINCFSVLFSGAPLLGFNHLKWWMDILIALWIGLLVAALVQFVVVRKLRASFAAEAGKKPQIVLPQTSFGKKVAKLPPLMEAAEKEPPEGSNTQLDEGEAPTGSPPPSYREAQTEVQVEPRRVRIESLHSASSPQTVEEAKLLRQQTSKRSRSTGGQYTPSVRIPAVLQLEKNVLKANVPSIRELKEEMRRNFSEPAMASLARRSDADVYEVFINRQRRLITIQRKVSSEEEPPAAGAEEPELEKLLSSIPPDLKMEDPFEESEDEGLAMVAPTSGHHPTTIYSGAIEEGFRRLSSSQQNIIAIKIGDGEGEEKSVAEEMEAKEGRPEVRRMFSFLQILTACFGSFAHGGNDVSNAIGPLIAIWIIYNESGVQQKSSTPLWILLYGGVGICAGLWAWGRRVIKTMGKDLTDLTPSRGFAIELMSAITVLLASNIGLPVSTTHCKVGAVVAVGWVRSREAVDWKIFRNICLAWFVTVPISGGLSAAIFAVMRAAIF